MTSAQPESNPAAQSTAETHDRRRWPRNPLHGEAATISTSEATFATNAIDDSIGGVGVETNSAAPVATGQIVTVEYQGIKRSGQIAGIYPFPNGGCRLSICWDGFEAITGQDFGPTQMFFSYRDVNVRCDVINASEDPTCEIRLLDGSERTVPRSQVVHRCRKSRCTELLTMGPARSVIAEIYQLPERQLPPEQIKAILDLEFGTD